MKEKTYCRFPIVCAVMFLAIFGLLMTACSDGSGSKKDPTVTSVTVTAAGNATSITKGGTLQFSAEVSGTHNPAQTVTWTYTTTPATATAGISISTSGLLSVTNAATATAILVRATSTVDTSKSGTKSISVGGGEAALTSIAVTTPPTKTTYTVGETLNTAGIVVTATFSDSTTQVITSGLSYNPTTLNTVGASIAITVTYEDKTATFNVIVNAAGDPVTLLTIGTDRLPAPVLGAHPVRSFETAQYTAAVAWTPTVALEGTFAANTIYTAVIELHTIGGFTFAGVGANAFTVTSAVSATNAANTGSINATFARTGLLTLTAADFNIDDLGALTQTAGSVTAVEITKVTHGDAGAVTVLYDGSATLPQLAGTYPITINVAAGGDYAAATGLDMEHSLTVELRTIGQADFNVIPATIYYKVDEDTVNKTVTWHANAVWNTGANISVFYRGFGSTSYAKNAAAPTEIGEYEVIVDVAVNTGYFNAINELRVATFAIVDEIPILGDVEFSFTITQFKNPAASIDLAPVFSILAPEQDRKITLVNEALNDTQVRWTVGGAVTTGKELDVSGFNSIGSYIVMVEIQDGGVWYNKTFTFKITL